MKDIATFGEGYGWTEICYDEQNKRFIAKKYHMGSVDDAEEFYDGEHPISQYDTLKELIHNGKLSIVLRYYNELNARYFLEPVLMELEIRGQSIWPKDMQNTQLMENEGYTYYQFTESQFVVYVYHTYFLVEPMKSAQVDYMIVKELLENPDTVVYDCKNYGWNHRSWVKKNLHEMAKEQ